MFSLSFHLFTIQCKTLNLIEMADNDLIDTLSAELDHTLLITVSTPSHQSVLYA